jgi:hypothetical protein
MADVQKTVLIRHSAEQMFDLVTDVADYPNFLPWCGGVEVRHRDDTSMEAVNLKVAEQYVNAFGNLAKQGTTLIVPGNLADMSSMIASALAIVNKGKSGVAEAR